MLSSSLPVRACRVQTCFAWAVLPLGLALLVAQFAKGDLPEVVRVEEDWELVVGTPDANSDAPQVTCVISPTGDVDDVHAGV